MPISAHNCCGCGCLPCCCVKNTDKPEETQESLDCRKQVVHESVGDCTPVHPDPDKLIFGDCCHPEGGDMTIQAPGYELVVENPPDGVLRDSEGRPVLDLEGKVVAK